MGARAEAGARRPQRPGVSWSGAEFERGDGLGRVAREAGIKKRRVARGPWLRDLGRKPEMTENTLDHGRLIDERDQAHPSAAPRTGENVEAETPLHQARPAIARGSACVVERLAGVAALLGTTCARHADRAPSTP